MRKIFTIGALAAAMFLPEVVSAAELPFTYNTAGNEQMIWGTKKKETYDVAIRILDPALVGAKVTKLSVPFYVESENYSDPQAWLTTELALDKKVNVPNICSQTATVENNTLTVTFDEPYTITEAGVYAGYSFTITGYSDQSRYPVIATNGDSNQGFFLHTSRSYLKWTDMSESNRLPGCVSYMTVYLEGDFPACGAILQPESLYYGEAGKAGVQNIVISNKGTEVINNVDFTVKAGDKTSTGSYTFADPVPGFFNATGNLPVEIPALDATGTYPLEITINKVNGNENTVNGATATTSLQVLPFIPVNRPLAEEYTGTWCGWCPRGYVALENMRNQYGDKFVAAAYHNGDPMQVTQVFPSTVSGFPFAYLNRVDGIDPFYIYELYPQEAAKMAPCDIDVKAEWADADHTKILATTNTRFTADEENANYRLVYILIADGLKGAEGDREWWQSNYFSGKDAYADMVPGDLGKVFLEGGSKIEGLEFNDVVVACPEMRGIANSLPKSIVAGQAYEHTYEFDLSKVLTSSKEQIIQDKNKVRVIGVVLNTKGAVLNSNSSLYASGDTPWVGVEEISGNAGVEETIFYDLQGRRVAHPANGMYIKVDRLDNGTTRVNKVIVRDRI